MNSNSEENAESLCPDNGTVICDTMKMHKKGIFEGKSCAVNTLISEKTSQKSKQACVRSVDLGTSGGVQTALQEVPFMEPQEVFISTPLINNTKKNNIYKSNTESNLIVSEINGMGLDEMGAYSELIKENIEYDCLMERYPCEQELIKGIFDLILEMILSKNEFMIIASSTYPLELVRSKFLKLDYSHVEYVIGCLQRNTTKVKNIKKYLLAALFNAPSTINGYFRAEVNHDMPQFALAK